MMHVSHKLWYHVGESYISNLHLFSYIDDNKYTVFDAFSKIVQKTKDMMCDYLGEECQIYEISSQQILIYKGNILRYLMDNNEIYTLSSGTSVMNELELAR